MKKVYVKGHGLGKCLRSLGRSGDDRLEDLPSLWREIDYEKVKDAEHCVMKDQYFEVEKKEDCVDHNTLRGKHAFVPVMRHLTPAECNAKFGTTNLDGKRCRHLRHNNTYSNTNGECSKTTPCICVMKNYPHHVQKDEELCVLMGGEWKKKWSVINGRNIKDTDNDKEEKKKIFKDYYNKFKYEVGSQSNWACSSDTEESTAEKSYTNVWGDKKFDNVCQCDGGNIWKDGECRNPYDSGDVITWTHPCWGGRYFSHGKSRGNAQKIDF